MFRSRQPMYPAPSGEVVFERIQVNERGEADLVLVNDSKAVLPDVETTDLKQLLAAGIDPRQVNTRVLVGNQVVIDLSVEDQTNIDNEKK